MTSDLEKERGKGVTNIEVCPTEPYPLKGVQYAAKKCVAFIRKEQKWEQGWIYGFTEPYQVFVLYTLVEKEGFHDRQDLKKILDSFEFITKK